MEDNLKAMIKISLLKWKYLYRINQILTAKTKNLIKNMLAIWEEMLI